MSTLQSIEAAFLKRRNPQQALCCKHKFEVIFHGENMVNFPLPQILVRLSAISDIIICLIKWKCFILLVSVSIFVLSITFHKKSLSQAILFKLSVLNMAFLKL